MTWIRVESNMVGDRRVQAARMALGVSTPEMIGYLVIFYGETANHNIEGKVDDVHDETLEEWAKWRGEPGAFAREFRRWFTSDGEIADWEEMQGKLIERRKSDAKRKRAERERAKAAQRELSLSEDSHADGPQDAPEKGPLSAGRSAGRPDPNVYENGNVVVVVEEAELKDFHKGPEPPSDPPPSRTPDTPEARVVATIRGAPPAHPDPVREGKDDRTRSLELTIAVNKGLQANPAIQNFMPALPYSTWALDTAARIADAGIEHAWALSAAYTLAKNFQPDPEKLGDTIGSIAYLKGRLDKPWQQEVALRAASTAESPPEARTVLEATTADPSKMGPPASQGARRNGQRDLKGEGLRIFGDLRDAVKEEKIYVDPSRGDEAGSYLGRVIKGDALEALSPAARAALKAIGGPRTITSPPKDDPSWKFAAAYASAASDGMSTKPTTAESAA